MQEWEIWGKVASDQTSERSVRPLSRRSRRMSPGECETGTAEAAGCCSAERHERSGRALNGQLGSGCLARPERSASHFPQMSCLVVFVVVSSNYSPFFPFSRLLLFSICFPPLSCCCILPKWNTPPDGFRQSDEYYVPSAISNCRIGRGTAPKQRRTGLKVGPTNKVVSCRAPAVAAAV
ncbi:hypothetical protein B0J18DRAFT_70558 [Chaetomium sp. MPI-SDFR-AT-0129]|nr:hypothetical protein B0J18DRAFT_70558 [Chaetomium sp. MPI-SDFR-AT-0129]